MIEVWKINKVNIKLKNSQKFGGENSQQDGSREGRKYIKVLIKWPQRSVLKRKLIASKTSDKNYQGKKKYN